MIYTTEDLVTSVKRRTLAPTSQKTFQDADIIALLNEELEAKIVPEILAVREDYFLNSGDSSIVSGVEAYPIKERAIGGALKDVWFIQNAGTSSEIATNLRRLSLSDKTESTSLSGYPSGYYMQDNYVVLLPKPSASTGSVRQWYLQRPSELVATTSCAMVTGITSLAGTTTFDVNTDLTGSLSVGSTIDFVKTRSPNLLWAKDVAITSISTTQIAVLTTNVVDASGTVPVVVGDYISKALHANIPLVPQEFHPLLAERAAARIVQALGHSDKLQAINQSIAEMHAYAMKMISNRVESDARAVINRSGISVHATSGFGRWRF